MASISILFREEDRSRMLALSERVLHTVVTFSYGLLLALMAPLLWGWVQAPSGLTPFDHGAWAPFLTLCGVGVMAWGLRDLVSWRRLGRVAAPTAAQPAAMLRQPAVLVTGATGFVGRALVAELSRASHRVIVLSRDPRRARALFDPGVWVVDELDAIPSDTRIDALVNLAGARVLGMPWTRARRQVLLGSRVGITQQLIGLMRRLDHCPRVLVSASAVGFYGAVNDGTPCTETSPPKPGEFQSDLCAAIEHEARRAEALGARVVLLRLGVVLGLGGGAYPMQALAARLGVGARLGTGQQPVPWLHRDDAVGLICFALKQTLLRGAVNAVAPDTPRQSEFAQALAASFGRRLWLSAPASPLRHLAGEMSTILLDGQNAIPAAALAAGYRFRHPTLQGALANLAARQT